jgi:ABC-2 type transport system permease protein
MRKYFHALAFSAKNQFIYLPAFLTQNVFFAVILFTFYSLWSAIYAGKGLILHHAGLTLSQTLWYLTFTEAIELSKSGVMQDIQTQVKDGSIAYIMGRPHSFIVYNLFDSMGTSVVKIVPILAAGFILGSLFTGILPGYIDHLPFGLVLFLGSLVLNTLWHIALGLLAFWFEEVTPFYWILQKAIFVLGGMFFPLDFMPDWLQAAAKALPFAFSAYWPGRVMVDFSPDAFFTALAGQAAYIALLGGVTLLLFSRGKRRLQVQGG